MKKFVMMLAMAAASMATMAQNDECAVDFTLYKEFVNVEAYSAAIPSYWNVFNNCPKFSKSLYLDGVKIYKHQIEASQDANEINAYVDTLKMIYKQRIENFGEEAMVTGRCGLDVMRYRKTDTANTEAYHIIAQSIKLELSNAETSTLSAYIYLATTLAIQNKISKEEYLSVLMPSISNIKKNASLKDEKYQKQTEQILTTLRKNITKVKNVQAEFDILLDSKYQVPENLEDTEIMMEVLNEIGATGSQLYAQVAEKLYSTNPTAEAAASIARYARKNKDWNKASQYYKEALEMTDDEMLKSTFLYEAASVANNQKKFQEAISLAKKSISLNPNNGASHLLIAAIYMTNANACSDDAFIRREIYWVAADYAAKCKRVDTTLEHEANTLLSKCVAQFPNKEDAFMHSVKPGDTVKINAFDTETTTARF